MRGSGYNKKKKKIDRDDILRLTKSKRCDVLYNAYIDDMRYVDKRLNKKKAKVQMIYFSASEREEI